VSCVECADAVGVVVADDDVVVVDIVVVGVCVDDGGVDVGCECDGVYYSVIDVGVYGGRMWC